MQPAPGQPPAPAPGTMWRAVCNDTTDPEHQGMAWSSGPYGDQTTAQYIAGYHNGMADRSHTATAVSLVSAMPGPAPAARAPGAAAAPGVPSVWHVTCATNAAPHAGAVLCSGPYANRGHAERDKNEHKRKYPDHDPRVEAGACP